MAFRTDHARWGTHDGDVEDGFKLKGCANELALACDEGDKVM
jgi:hypothetical protein